MTKEQSILNTGTMSDKMDFKDLQFGDVLLSTLESIKLQLTMGLQLTTGVYYQQCTCYQTTKI